MTGAAALLAVFHYVPLLPLAVAALILIWYALLTLAVWLMVRFLTK